MYVKACTAKSTRRMTFQLIQRVKTRTADLGRIRAGSERAPGKADEHFAGVLVLWFLNIAWHRADWLASSRRLAPSAKAEGQRMRPLWDIMRDGLLPSPHAGSESNHLYVTLHMLYTKRVPLLRVA